MSNPVNASRPTSRRIPELDALRGIAALLVVLYHFTAGYGAEFGWVGSHPIINIRSAQVGVAIFFIISGFVIALTLERCRTVGDFAFGRFARLYPTFWFCALLTSTLIYVADFNPYNLNVAGFVSNFTMANGLTALPYPDPSYWTLTREISFYFLLGMMYFKFDEKNIPLAILLWIVGCALFNIITPERELFTCHNASSCTSVLFNTMFAYLFAAGTMIYRIYKGDHRNLVFVTLFTAILSGSVTEFGSHGVQFVISVKATLYVGLILVCVFNYANFLANRVMVFLGAISYAVYLIHQVIGSLILKQLLTSGYNATLSILLTLAVILIGASLIYLFVERPSQKALRHWHFKRRATNRPPEVDRGSISGAS